MANSDILVRWKSDTSQYDANIAKARRQLTGFTKDNLTAGGVAKQLTSSLVSMAAGFASVTAAVSALSSAIKSNIATARGFEKSMSQLSSLTGMVGDDLEKLKGYAIELGATTTLSASQVADAFKMIGSQQPQLLASGEALKAVTKNAITLAEAAGIELADAASTLSVSINQMGGDSSNAERYINVLAAASQKGAGDIAWLGEAITKSGTVAKAVGTDYEELVANLEQLAKAGYDASTAGTALRSIIMNLEKQANSEYKPSVVGLTAAFENLNKANLTLTQYQEIAGKLFAAQAKALAEAAGEAKNMTEAITGTNTAQEQAKTNTDNLDGALKSLSSAWEGLNLHINDSNGFLREGVDELTQTVRMADQLILTIQGLDGVFGTVGKGIKQLVLGPLEALNAKIGLINFGLKYMQNLMSGATGIAPGTGSDAGAALGAAIGKPASSGSSPAAAAAAAAISSGGGKGGKIDTITGGIKGLEAFDSETLHVTESMKSLREQLSNFRKMAENADNPMDYARAQQGIADTQAKMGVQPMALRMGLDTESMLEVKDNLEAFGEELRSQIKPIEIKPKLDVQTLKLTTENANKAAGALASIGSALQSIDNPGAQVAGLIATAIANIATSFSGSLRGTFTPWDWIAAAAAGTATMITTITAIKKATAGSYAEGGIVPGNSYSGDNLIANVNSGELILSAIQQNTLAGMLQGGGGGQPMQPYVDGEMLFLGLSNYLRREGRGELVTSRR